MASCAEEAGYENQRQDVEVNDMSFRDFVDNVLVNGPPKEPFHYRIEFLETQTKGKQRTCLIYALVQVSHKVVGKKTEELSKSDIDYVQEYIHSFGFHIRYEPNPESEKVKAGKPLEELTIRDCLLFFETANPLLRQN